LALDRDLLRELLGADELRELLDPGVLADLELELQHLADGRRARDVDEVHDLLRRLGDLSLDEIDQRCEGDHAPASVDELVDARRGIAVNVAGEPRFVAAEDAGKLRDALGVPVPPGLPMAFLESAEHPLDELVARYARTHGPFRAVDAARRLGAPLDRVRDALGRLEGAGRVLQGEFRPGGIEREWVDDDVLRVLRRRSLATLRKEVEPVDAATLGRFVPAWHGVGERRRGVDALVDAVGRLQGAPIPASILESDVLPARVEGYRPADLDALCAAGEVVWLGAGTIGANDGRVALYLRDELSLLARRPAELDGRPDAAVHDAIRVALEERGALFWPDLVRAAGTAEEAVVLGALWDLVWAGEVTNDTLAPLRASLGGAARRRSTRGRPRPGRLTRLGPPAGAGRWSLVAPLLEPEPPTTQRAHARARALLERHGVVAREAVRAEGVEGGFAAVYGVLKAMEETGAVRRGYFVAGLGAAQFALPGAVDRLRSAREDELDDTSRPPAHPVVLAAADPANPYGAALPWPECAGRPARVAGAHVVLLHGEPAVFVERGGRRIVTFPAASTSSLWVDGLVSLVKEGRVSRLVVQHIDGEPATSSSHAALLRAAGFADGYRGLTLSSR